MAEKEYDYLRPGRRYASKHSTAFAASSLREIKAMVVYADPEEIRAAGHGWDAFHEDLVGGEDGGVLGVLDALVARLTRSWQGAAAEAFRAEMERFHHKIADTAEHARYLSTSLRGAANALQEYKTHIDAMPPADDDLLGTMARISEDPTSRMSAEDVLTAGRGRLSAGERHGLEAVVVMEQLGGAYNSQVEAMGTWNREKLTAPDCPGAPGGTVPLAEVSPIPYAVFSGDAPVPPPPPPAESPIRTGVGGVLHGLGAVTGAAAVSGGATEPGVTGGVPQQDPARRGGSAVPHDVLSAALPVTGADTEASPGGSGLHRGPDRSR